MRKFTVSVIGGHEINKAQYELATKVGEIIAKCGAILVCGGLTGAMEAAAKGAKQAGGLTIGILPGRNKADANPYIDIPLPTSLGYSRNVIVACSADLIVALPGSCGTNTEICYGIIYDRPVVDFGNWNLKGMIQIKNLDELEKLIKKFMAKHVPEK